MIIIRWWVIAAICGAGLWIFALLPDAPSWDAMSMRVTGAGLFVLAHWLWDMEQREKP